MEVVQQKYDNFRAFLSNEVPNAFWLSLVTSAPLETFLRGVYERKEKERHAMGGKLTIEQITDRILVETGLRREQFTLSAIAKFQLYTEYFLDVSTQLYGPSKS